MSSPSRPASQALITSVTSSRCIKRFRSSNCFFLSSPMQNRKKREIKPLRMQWPTPVGEKTPESDLWSERKNRKIHLRFMILPPCRGMPIGFWATLLSKHSTTYNSFMRKNYALIQERTAGICPMIWPWVF